MDFWIYKCLIVVFYGLTGYITNLLAIRMLFRPYKVWRLGRFKVPFTPGLIPKEKDKLAGKIGTSVTYLISPDVMSGRIQEQETIDGLYTTFNRLIETGSYGSMIPSKAREWLFVQMISRLLINLPAILEHLDVSSMISKAITNLSTMEMEELVMDVARRELKAITWLGAGLGAFLGIIQIVLTEIL